MAKTEICSCNILSVEATTNCPQGGDGGHGGQTEIIISDEGGTSWDITIDGHVIDQPSQIKMTVYGDSECSTIIRALEFAAKTLRQSWASNKQVESRESGATTCQ